MKKVLAVLLSIVPLSQALAETPVPTHLKSCVNTAVSALAASDGNITEVRRLFKLYVDSDRLGRTVWKGAWKNSGQKWKDTAIALYQDLLVSKGRAAVGNADVIKVTTRVADYPDRGGDGSNGYWHIVFLASLSDGRNISAAALVTDNCKVIELSQGIWIGNTISAGDVDAAVKAN